MDFLTLILSFSFMVICVFSLLILTGTFFSSYNFVKKLSIGNLVLLITIVVFFSYENNFDFFTQLRWGYYTFAVAQLCVLICSIKIRQGQLAETVRVREQIGNDK